MIPNGSPDFGNGEWESPVVAIAITPGAAVQADYSAASEGFRQGVEVVVTYTDVTTERIAQTREGAGTMILTLTQSKTIERVAVVLNRGHAVNPASDNYFTLIPEVRVIGA